jgi:hypothetical protein
VRDKVKAKLEAAGVSLTAYGVVKAKSTDEWKRIFEFARDMGVQSLTAEPTPEQLADVDKLANEFGIPVALHNHPKNSRANEYWGPEQVLEALKGRSNLMGACADTGHWVRSGLDPADALKQLEGRLVSLHLKDLQGGRDVPWGTGASNFAGQIAELSRQGFRGSISIEYEHVTPELVDNVAACVASYYRATGALGLRDGRPVKQVMVAVPDAVFSRFPRGAAGTWPARPEAGGAAGRPGKPKEWGPEHKTPYRCKAGSLSLYACGNGFDSEGPAMAFDGKIGTKWCIGQDKVWLEWAYGDGKPQTVTRYSIVSANDDPRRDPRDWQLLGSKDGKEWTVVDERKDERFASRHKRLTFDVKTPGAYPQYKLNVSRNRGDSRTQLAEIELHTAQSPSRRGRGEWK